MSVEQEYNRFLSRQSSPIDWCEKNYEYNNYIAELFNTISNIPMILGGILSAYNAYRQGMSPKMIILFSMFTAIGLSSTWFHATLSFGGQLADEITILWAMIWSLTIKRTMKEQKLVLILGVLASILVLFAPELNAVCLILFASVHVYYLDFFSGQYRDKEIPKLKIWAQIFFFVAVFSWILERTACSRLSKMNIPFLELHAVWHLLIFATVYTACTLVSFFESSDFQLEPSFKYFFGIPYVTNAKRKAKPS